MHLCRDDAHLLLFAGEASKNIVIFGQTLSARGGKYYVKLKSELPVGAPHHPEQVHPLSYITVKFCYF